MEWLAPALVTGIVLLLVAGGFRWGLFGRAKLRTSLSLRGTARTGTLYVHVENAGRRLARDVRFSVWWEGARGQAPIETAHLGDIEPVHARTTPVRALARAITTQPDGWERLVVRVEAANARAATAALDLAPRRSADAAGGVDAGADETPAVRYVRAVSPECPEAPGRKHAYQEDRVLSDGVVERWRVCRYCRHVQREPLTPEEMETQRRVRRERAAREQARLEQEWARQAARDPGGRARRPPPREPDDGSLPVTVAFWILGLDAATATWNDVIDQHRKLALRYHPDRAGAVDERTRRVLQEKMQDVNAAKDRLREHFAADAAPRS